MLIMRTQVLVNRSCTLTFSYLGKNLTYLEADCLDTVAWSRFHVVYNYVSMVPDILPLGTSSF